MRKLENICNSLSKTRFDTSIFTRGQNYPNSLRGFKKIFPIMNIQYNNLKPKDFKLIISSYIERTDDKIEDILCDIGRKIEAFYRDGKGSAEMAVYKYVLKRAKEIDPELRERLKESEQKRRRRNAMENIQHAHEWLYSLSPEELSDIQSKRNASRSKETIREVSRAILKAQGKIMYDKEISGLTEREYIFALASSTRYHHQKGSWKDRPDWKKITAKVNEVYGNNRAVKSLTELYRRDSGELFGATYLT